MSIVKRDLLDDESARINLVLSQQESAALLQNAGLNDSRLPQELIVVLDGIAPTYRAGLWQEHDRANKAWIQAVRPLLETHESALRQTLERVFDSQWPDEPIRTDVSSDANWAGAYTNLGPTHITISSTNPAYQGDGALEMLLHEASHALIGKTRGVLATESKSQKRQFRTSDLWHAVIFFTAGEAVPERIEGYVPYAVKNRLYTGRWNVLFEILSNDWAPYMRGEIDMADSAKRLVATFGVEP